MGQRAHEVVFLLEALEHIGVRERFYESKIEFLQRVAQLVKPGGQIIVSVPARLRPKRFGRRPGSGEVADFADDNAALG